MKIMPHQETVSVVIVAFEITSECRESRDYISVITCRERLKRTMIRASDDNIVAIFVAFERCIECNFSVLKQIHAVIDEDVDCTRIHIYSRRLSQSKSGIREK